MSYPFGSGMPPLPNNSNSAPYPPINLAPPFGASSGYPPTQPNAPYPQSNSYPQQPHSNYPSAQTHAYPTMPSAYPPNPNPNPGYPTHQYQQQPSMPFGAGFAASSGDQYAQNSYPPPSSTTTTSTNFPPIPSSNFPNSSFLPSQQGYSGHGGFQQPSSSGGGGYPNAVVNNMANCFSAMQGHIKDVRKTKGNPTLVPAQNFDPLADAHALRKAMKGFGTDEDALINIICRRTNEQRQIIQRTYKTNFGKDLIEDIRSETSGNFENLLVALLTPIVDFYVKELHDAMAGIGTDEDVLIEVLCTMSNYEIHTIKNAYVRLYGQNLESELISETSGNFKRLLVALCAGGRDESGIVDPEAAHRDATELLRAGELRAGTDESTFNMVFCQRNFAQIKLICEKYQQMTGHGLEKAIRNEFSGDILDGLIAILQCTTNKAEFFASRLHKSMAGIGTNDTQLIRLIVTRCEIDLNDIKVAFERLYGKSLRSWIKGDTSGHYKHALYALIGEQRSS